LLSFKIIFTSIDLIQV